VYDPESDANGVDVPFEATAAYAEPPTETRHEAWIPLVVSVVARTGCMLVQRLGPVVPSVARLGVGPLLPRRMQGDGSGAASPSLAFPLFSTRGIL
jgi:hypothetical protein